MAKKCSQAVEILPGSTIDWLLGSTKNCTARITKNGSNVIMPKIKQPNKTGADPNMFKGAGEKWRAMNADQKLPWINIAKEKSFRSPWNAFISSFLKSATIHGLEYTMSHELKYISSDSRYKKAEQLNNSIQRLNQYKVEPAFYTDTKEILKQYPVELSSPHIYLKLLDLTDVNNALRMKLLYRTDDFAEYQFYSVEIDRNTEKGSYTLIKRARQGVELYQFIH